MFDRERPVSPPNQGDDDSRRMFDQTLRFFPYEISMDFYNGFYLVENKIPSVENRQISLLFEQKFRAVLETPLRPALPLFSLKTIHTVVDRLKERLYFLERSDFILKVDFKKYFLFLLPPKRSERMKQMRDIP
jgi:hypothetical protein